ncbi:MAG: hypothetical protein LBU79_00395 [Planctomycetota bacterium]|jgi:cell division protein FtsB|nr:hypothetical protein [Planctomycetota bacterium]
MDDDSRWWFFSTPLATLLFCGAVAIFLLGYLPEARRAKESEAKVAAARKRISELLSQEERTKRRIAELEAGVPEAVTEALREVMRLGAKGDFVLENLDSR